MLPALKWSQSRFGLDKVLGRVSAENLLLNFDFERTKGKAKKPELILINICKYCREKNFWHRYLLRVGSENGTETKIVLS